MKGVERERFIVVIGIGNFDDNKDLPSGGSAATLHTLRGKLLLNEDIECKVHRNSSCITRYRRGAMVRQPQYIYIRPEKDASNIQLSQNGKSGVKRDMV